MICASLCIALQRTTRLRVVALRAQMARHATTPICARRGRASRARRLCRYAKISRRHVTTDATRYANLTNKPGVQRCSVAQRGAARAKILR